MKELVTSDDRNALSGVLTESDGPPLEHDEWVEEQNRAHEEERKQQEKDLAARRAAAKRPDRVAAEDDDEEPSFRGRKLSEFDGVPDEELEQQEGVGEATAKEIIKARHKRDRRAARGR